MNQLTNLEIEELSLVDKGANPGARVTIYKSADLPHRNIVAKASGNPVRTAREASERIEERYRQRQSSGMPDQAEDDFDAMVEQIAARDGVPRVEAMRRARRERPELFQKYQSEQRGLIAKAAPQPVTKSDAVIKFEALIDGVASRDKCSKVEAMRRARRQYPAEFAAYASA